MNRESYQNNTARHIAFCKISCNSKPSLLKSSGADIVNGLGTITCPPKLLKSTKFTTSAFIVLQFFKNDNQLKCIKTIGYV